MGASGKQPKFKKDSLDVQKLEYSLFVPEFLEEVVKVLTFGAVKYGRENWKKCKDKRLYIDAIYRHLEAYRMGEKTDKDTGCHHFACVCCNIMFIFWMDMNND